MFYNQINKVQIYIFYKESNSISLVKRNSTRKRLNTEASERNKIKKVLLRCLKIYIFAAYLNK